MPETVANGIRLHYVDRGEGPETVVFSHSYLVDHRHFEAQIEGLADRYRVLAYDHRDHGGSQRAEAPYDLEAIYQDGLAFVEAVGAAPCHWVGLSTGGFVGVRLALRRPELLRSLVLMDTAADAEPLPSRLKYSLMLTVVGLFGYRPVLRAATKAMLGRETLRDPDKRQLLELWAERFQENDPAAMIRFGRAIFWRSSIEDRLGSIRIPTLVLRGEQDRAIARKRARRTASSIPGATYREIPAAGHLSTVERPELVTEILREFLAAA